MLENKAEMRVVIPVDLEAIDEGSLVCGRLI